jgi:hypothetical protein
MELLIFFDLLQYFIVFRCLKKLGNAVVLIVIPNAINALMLCEELSIRSH